MAALARCSKWDVLFELDSPLGHGDIVNIRAEDTIYVEALRRRVYQLNQTTNRLEYVCQACQYDKLDNCFFTIQQVDGRHWFAYPTVLHLNFPEQLWFGCWLSEDVCSDKAVMIKTDQSLHRFLHLLYTGREFTPSQQRIERRRVVKKAKEKADAKGKGKAKATTTPPPQQHEATPPSTQKRKRKPVQLPEPTPEIVKELGEEVVDLTAEAGGSEPKPIPHPAYDLYISFAHDLFAITCREPQSHDLQIVHVRELYVLLRELYNSEGPYYAALSEALVVRGIAVRDIGGTVTFDLNIKEAATVMGTFYSRDFGTPPAEEAVEGVAAGEEDDDEADDEDEDDEDEDEEEDESESESAGESHSDESDESDESDDDDDDDDVDVATGA